MERTETVTTTDLTGQRFIVTGGSGFFGDFFVALLLERGADVVNIDILPTERKHERLMHQAVDIRDRAALQAAFHAAGKIDAVFHFAALLAHGSVSEDAVMSVNAEGTRVVLDCCRVAGVGHLVFTSSNCLWGEPVGRPILEDEPPRPCEAYGRSKLAAEEILRSSRDVVCAIIRTPTIIQAGRLGLLAILFEFIDEGRKVWVVGNGSNRYQFIGARDLAEACLAVRHVETSDVFNVGSDRVPTLRATYEHVIRVAGSGARVAEFPKWLAVPAMKVAHWLRCSPLGPYHWRMIAESFEFDTRKLKALGWSPLLSNDEILVEAFEYYRVNKGDIQFRRRASAHRQAAPMGAIRLLKWLS